MNEAFAQDDFAGFASASAPAKPAASSPPPKAESTNTAAHSPSKSSVHETPPHPPAWGAASFFMGSFGLGLLAIMFVFFLNAAFQAESNQSRVMLGFEFGEAVAILWILFIPINLAGLIAGIIGLNYKDMNQTLTYWGLGTNGVSFMLLLLFTLINFAITRSS